ncbi:MAG: chromate efflux transporter [Candidatus Eisenbacteria bacterium]|nr:chromate efflux transporter [Candidatus Eisenbacteria bacterium]
MNDGRERESLGTIALIFLRLGLTAFGGPAAHVSLMEDQFVRRRRWLSTQHFLDLIGATNLIPGPNSTEITMHLGYERAGRRGLFVAGAAFILPAVALTGAFAWFYVRYGALPAVEPFLAGIKPAVIAVILGALRKLGKKAIIGAHTAALALFVALLTVAGVEPVFALLAGGAAGMLGHGLFGRHGTKGVSLALPALRAPTAGETIAAGGVAGAAAGVSLLKLGLVFLKVGAVLYGSGYVLIAFLEGDLVGKYGWLTRTQLLDAIALGQFTPGPVLSAATFIGYVIAGAPGAAVATIGIFLPSFFIVLLLNPVIPRLRRSPWTAAFLDAVNAGALALMAIVTIQLGRAVLLDPPAWAIVILASVAVLRFRVNPVWIILGGALFGSIWRLAV